MPYDYDPALTYSASHPKTKAIVAALHTGEMSTGAVIDWIYRFVYATETYDGPSKVYFVAAAATHLVKIGRSGNPYRRLGRLQLLSPVPLRIAGVVNGGSEVETLLHDRFGFLRSHGEWFHATHQLSAFISAVRIDGASA